MNTVLIFAGGTGMRMHTKTLPKQFLELNGKPILIHTVEYFENHPEIDKMVIVCIEHWIPYCKELLVKFQIKKAAAVISGGKTGQESIFFGLQYIYSHISADADRDIVLIHDGVRPMITEKLISDNIACVKKNGNCITVAPVIETIIEVNEKEEMTGVIDRAWCRHAKAPQSFRLNDIYKAHMNAIQEGKTNLTDSATLMSLYGHTLYTVECGPENIKITTPSDFYILRAFMEARENSQILGL